MPLHDPNETTITRDGFSYTRGVLYAEPGHVERLEGIILDVFFLPTSKTAGRNYLRKGGKTWVRGQLRHYGVEYDEGELTGNGRVLLQKVLREGKCREVPHHIENLRREMHKEWIAKSETRHLIKEPKWVLEKFFLVSAEKKTEVLAVPYEDKSWGADSRARVLGHAAAEVPGLNHAISRGSKAVTVLLGWDAKAVKEAVALHVEREKEAEKAAREEREKRREALHARYLKKLEDRKEEEEEKNKETPVVYSPAGRYMIDCGEIEHQWPDLAENMKLNISPKESGGVFQASFDFGVIEGAMVLSLEQEDLELYDTQSESDSDSDEEEDEDEDEEDSDSDDYDEFGPKRKPSSPDRDDDEDERRIEKDEDETETGSKRKASSPDDQDRPVKKARPEMVKYFLKLRCRETGEGETSTGSDPGFVVFESEKMDKFVGMANFPWVGQSTFTGRKIGDRVPKLDHVWDEFIWPSYDLY
ncbi:hypothetical protein GGS20DRAFT_533020 [Poronia punctata]|nr:hypothetical protein GGS20DRAFT_533020 [Poronia punctata]